MSAWWPSRRRVAGAAILVALLTGWTGALIGASSGFTVGGIALVAFAVLALRYPIAIAAQVTTGAFLVGSLVLFESPTPSVILPLVAGIVATAELLALTARLKEPQPRIHGDDLSRIGLAVVLGGAVFGAVLVVGGLPGPRGLLAVALASGACVVLSVVLVGRSH